MGGFNPDDGIVTWCIPLLCAVLLHLVFEFEWAEVKHGHE